MTEDADTGEVMGTVSGVNHDKTFGDPESACILWCLAVEFQASKYGVGEALVRTAPSTTRTRACLHGPVRPARQRRRDRPVHQAGFERAPVFAVKRKNTINEPLSAQPLVIKPASGEQGRGITSVSPTPTICARLSSTPGRSGRCCCSRRHRWREWVPGRVS